VHCHVQKLSGDKGFARMRSRTVLHCFDEGRNYRTPAENESQMTAMEMLFTQTGIFEQKYWDK
jgi:hypothetical protein